jgi:DNA-binding transcriptional LysR family regulator
MDVDMALLRAFVVTADERHFGRAAIRLHLSQQALSKRIQRLERLLGVRLLDRTSRRVEMTTAGARFLPHARTAVDAADAALAVLGVGEEPLRVDVLDEHVAPLQWVLHAVEREPALSVDVTMRQDAREVVSGLRNGDFDLAFGRAGAIEPPWPDDISRRLVLLEPVGLLVGPEHALADAGQVTVAELPDHRLWFPMTGAPAEWIEYVDEFTERFELRLDRSGSTMGYEHFVASATGETRTAVQHPAWGDRVGTPGEAARATFFGLAMPRPPGDAVRIVPIAAPTPVYPWWIMWRKPVPPQIIEHLVAAAGPKFELADVWLPDRDRMLPA